MFRTFYRLILSAIFIVFAFNLKATVLKVDDTGYTIPMSGGTLTLPQAIASASPGDTILINVKGTMFIFGPDLVFDKPLTIIGPSASHFTIDANSWQIKFDFAGGNLHLEGIRFINSPCPCGPFLSILQSANVTMKDCVFDGLITGSNGGAINMQNTSVLNVDNCSFFNCSTGAGIGGAIYVDNGNTANIRNSTFFNCSAFEGGAIYSNGTLHLVNNTFLNNSSLSGTPSGHAVKDGNVGGVTTIQNNIFTDANTGNYNELLAGSILNMWQTDGGNIFPSSNVLFDFISSGGTNDMFSISYSLLNLRTNPITDGYGLKYFPITSQTSAAVDNGTAGASTSATDCRRAPRALYGDNLLAIDAGAVEFSPYRATSPASASFTANVASMDASVFPGPKYMDFDVGGVANYNLTAVITNTNSSGVDWIMDGFTQDGSIVPGPGATPGTFTPGTFQINIQNGASDVIHLINPGLKSFISGFNIDNSNSNNGITVDGGTIHIYGNNIVSSALGFNGIQLLSGNTAIIGGDLHYFRNVIGRNTNAGIQAGNNMTEVKGNFIGTNSTGTAANSNDKGIQSTGSGINVIGKIDFPSMNVISGNNTAQIEISSLGIFDIRGNLIGPNSAGTASVSACQFGIHVMPNTEGFIGGKALGEMNVIGGNSEGILLNGSNRVVMVNNFIGLSHKPPFFNISNSTGINIYNNGDNFHWIGDGTTSGMNIICYNTNKGIAIEDGYGHLVNKNLIGIKPDNTAAGNGSRGIHIFGSSSNNNSIFGNVISNHGSAGIDFSGTAGSMIISGNKIGTDTSGLGAQANGRGIQASSNSNTTDISFNIISANTNEGLYLDNTPFDIFNNVIGLAVDSSSFLGNGTDGLVVINTSGSNISNNIVSANGNNGILFGNASSNTVRSNLIGTDFFNSNRGNTLHGIALFFAGTSNNTIGGTAVADRNIIAYNGGAGIDVEREVTTTNIHGNSFQFNGIKGILLGTNTVPTIPLANDLNDADASGPAAANVGNDGQNYPVLDAATNCAGTVTVGMTLNVDNSTADYRIQLYQVNPANIDASGHGEGDTLLVEQTVNAGGNNTFSFDVFVPGGLTGDIYSVTASKLSAGSYSTSEFSDTIIVKNSFTATASVSNNVLCFGQSNATITVTHGGTGPFVYDWINSTTGISTGINTITANVSAGSYYCAITDATCTVLSDTIIVTEPTALLGFATPVNPLCNLATNGSIDLFPSGGTMPYTFDWNNDGTGDFDDTEDLFSLGAGSYSITIQDVNGCNYSIPTINLIDPAAIFMTPTFTNETCSGLNDGSVTVTPFGGTSPYNYQIDGGGYSTITTYTGLTPGNHIVDILDANGCTSNILVNILPGDVVVANFTNSGPTICQNQPDFNFTNTSSTSAGTIMSYLWTLPSGSPSSGTTQNLSNVYLFNAGANTVTLQVINSNGCSDDTVMTVIANPSVFVDAGLDASICQNDPFTQAATISGGTAPLNINWQPSGHFINNTIEDAVCDPSFLNVIGSFSQILNVTDANGCTDADTMILTINSLPTVFAPADFNACIGSLITLSGSGSGISYSWDNSVIDGTPFNAAAATTTYTVTGTDGAGCTATDQVTVTPDLPVTINAGTDIDECRTTAFSANLNASVSNASMVSWSTSGIGTWTPDSLSASTQYIYSGADVSSPSITLTILGVSGNSCPNASDQLTVTFHDAPSVSVVNDFSVCSSGGTVLISGTPLNQAGVLWTSSGTGTFNPTNTTPTTNYDFSPSDILAGSVTLTLTATPTNLACPNATDDVLVTILTSPVANAGSDFQICNGQTAFLDGSSSTGSISIYQWDIVGTGTLSNAVTASDNPIVNTSYALTVDNGICSDSDTVNVTIISAPDASFNYSTTAYCQNNGPQTPTNIVTPGGTFSLPSSPGSINATTGTIDFTTLSPGVYNVYYTLTNPCFAVDSVSLNIFGLPDATVNNGTAQGCTTSPAFNLNSLFTPVTTGGTWTGTGVTDPNFDPFVSGAGVFVVTYTVTDVNGCTNSDTASVEVFAPPVVTFTGLSNAYCNTDAPFLPIGTPAGGLWSVNGSAFSAITSIDPALMPTGTAIPVNYQFTDATTGCTASAIPSSFTVYAMPLPPTTTSPSTQTVCAGSTVTLTATNPNTGNGTLTWFSDLGLTNQLGFGPSFSTPALTSNTTVYLSVVNPGCFSSVLTFDIIVNNASVSAGPDLTICPGTTAQLNVTSAVGSISWSPGVSLDDSTITNPIATPNINTTYVVTVNNGPCTASDSVNVFIDGSNPDCGIVPSYNAFSPDLDGVNDNWIIDAVINHPDNVVTIFNRWGDKLVTFEDYNNTTVVWDGTYNGNLLPSGTYFYVIEYLDISMQVSGWVQLTR